jgi:hypothetical protein
MVCKHDNFNVSLFNLLEIETAINGQSFPGDADSIASWYVVSCPNCGWRKRYNDQLPRRFSEGIQDGHENRA